MSKPAKDRRSKAHRHGIIGSNIKPGHTPGGFTRPFIQRKFSRRKDERPSVEEIKAAAETVLATRGVSQGPSEFDRTVRPNGEVERIRSWARDIEPKNGRRNHTS